VYAWCGSSIETSATDPHRSLAGVRRDAMDRIAK